MENSLKNNYILQTALMWHSKTAILDKLNCFLNVILKIIFYLFFIRIFVKNANTYAYISPIYHVFSDISDNIDSFWCACVCAPLQNGGYVARN